MLLKESLVFTFPGKELCHLVCCIPYFYLYIAHLTIIMYPPHFVLYCIMLNSVWNTLYIEHTVNVQLLGCNGRALFNLCILSICQFLMAWYRSLHCDMYVIYTIYKYNICSNIIRGYQSDKYWQQITIYWYNATTVIAAIDKSKCTVYHNKLCAPPLFIISHLPF